MRRLMTRPVPQIPSPEPLALLLERVRSARFSRGLACPRCRGRWIQRWGQFAGRQRYRCRGCRRTFSDLTGTPAAYVKKLGLWQRYAACLEEGLSVRRAAKRVGVQPSTAFRWRHRMLDALASAETDLLEGWVELGVVRLRYSEKGRRRLGRPARRRGWRGGGGRVVPVLVASDREGHVATSVVGVREGTRLSLGDVEAGLDGRLGMDAELLAPEVRPAAVSRYARQRGLRFRRVRPTWTRRARALSHGATVQAYAIRWALWLRRFRGVATVYLSHYLAWHAVVDRRARQGVEAAVLRWPLGDAYG
jgi:transposase-like protein